MVLAFVVVFIVVINVVHNFLIKCLFELAVALQFSNASDEGQRRRGISPQIIHTKMTPHKSKSAKTMPVSRRPKAAASVPLPLMMAITTNNVHSAAVESGDDG